LISETTRDKLNLAFGIGEQKQVRVKGINEPVSIYQVLSGGEEAPCA
jgi:class 3 adenylate cyclase